jgi:integrase
MASVFKRKTDRQKKHSKWKVSWYDHERGMWHTVTGYTDKGSSLEMGRRLEQESADRHEGITNNVREQSLRPIEEHLAGYMTFVKAGNRDSDYCKQLEGRIRRVLEATGAKRLVDLDATKVETELLKFTSARGFEKKGKTLISGTTRNEYATSLKGFSAWAADRRRIDHDPLAGLAKADESSVDRVHPRRALAVEEITALLDAAERRPEVQLLLVRRGKNKGQPLAKPRQAILARARQTGINRRKAYLLAIWSGLRRGELIQLRWKDVQLDSQVSFIQPRAQTTKSRRADTIPLHPQMAKELLDFRGNEYDPEAAVLPEVPSIKVLQSDLEFADIEYGNKEIGYADLHAQRMTLNTMLAGHGVGGRVRQAQLRHTDPRLTEDTYFDVSIFLKPHADEIAQVPAIPSRQAAEAASPENGGTCDEKRAQLGHKSRISSGHLVARGDAGDTDSDEHENESGKKIRRLQPSKLSQVGIKGHGPTLRVAEHFSKAGEGGRTLDIHVGNVTLYH